MIELFGRLIDRTPTGGSNKLASLIDGEHHWGGFARPASDVSDAGIRKFFETYGTTQVGCVECDNPKIFAGYYYIPPVVGKKTAHLDSSERIAVFQRVPIFRQRYKNVVLVKSYESDSFFNGEDILSLMKKKLFLDSVIQEVRDGGGLPVHEDTLSPI